MKTRHRVASGMDEQARDDGMYQAGQRGEEKPNPEAERAPLVLEI